MVASLRIPVSSSLFLEAQGVAEQCRRADGHKAVGSIKHWLNRRRWQHQAGDRRCTHQERTIRPVSGACSEEKLELIVQNCSVAR